MHVIYAPTDPTEGDRQEWDFASGRIRQSEAEQIERAAGQPLDQWTAAVLGGDSRARRVLLWHLMKREHPKIQIRDVPDFYFDELTVELDVAELQAMKKNLRTAPLSPYERDQISDAIDLQIAEKLGGDPTTIDGESSDAGEVGPGKAVTRRGPKSTG